MLSNEDPNKRKSKIPSIISSIHRLLQEKPRNFSFVSSLHQKNLEDIIKNIIIIITIKNNLSLLKMSLKDAKFEEQIKI